MTVGIRVGIRLQSEDAVGGCRVRVQGAIGDEDVCDGKSHSESYPNPNSRPDLNLVSFCKDTTLILTLTLALANIHHNVIT